MSFSIDFDRPLGVERRRIALEQIDGAIAGLDDSELSLDTRVHQLRKQCKKLRALARLFRAVNGNEYAAFNQALRNTARRVSSLRDADAALITLEKLLKNTGEHANTDNLRPLRGYLQAHREQEADRIKAEARLSTVRADLETVRESILQWSEPKISGKTLARGLARSYKMAYKAMRGAKMDGGSAAWHEWRKQAKYLRYQLGIVRQLWSTPLDCWQRDLHLLSDLIGLDHDLTELQRLLSRPVAGTTSPDDLKHLGKLCEAQSQVLRRDALALGEKLFEEHSAVMRRAVEVLLKRGAG